MCKIIAPISKLHLLTIKTKQFKKCETVTNYTLIQFILLSYLVLNKISLCIKYFLHFANYSKK